MKFSALSRTGFAVALSAVLASMMAPARAETVDSIFAKVSPSVRDRMFFRINYIRANVKTTSGDAYDVTGPVVARGDIARYLGTSSSYVSPEGVRKGTYQTQSSALDGAMTDDANAGCEAERSGLGTPCGIRARSQAMVGTPALSVGYFLDDEFNWVVEAFVLAAPMKVSIYGDGDNHLNGRNIINLKLLPPTAFLGRYFGSRTDVVRPFVGIGASYAMFFDARATEALNTYQGGASVNDTTVSVKNALGFGPFLGLRADTGSDWQVTLSVGKLRYKTDATLTTRNTTITRDSEVTLDYGVNVQGAIDVGNNSAPPTGIGARGVTTLMCDLAKAKYGASNGCNLGTYVRKQSTTLDNTLFVLGVGRSF